MITKEAMVAWLKEQPSEEYYEFTDPSKCPIAQFLKSKGFEWVSVGPELANVDNGKEFKVPSEVNATMCDRPRTYGAALKRLTS